MDKKIINEWIEHCLRTDYELGRNVNANITHLKKMINALKLEGENE